MKPAQNWRLSPIFKTLIGEKCESCGGIIFPPRDRCPKCGEEILSGENLQTLIREGNNGTRISQESSRAKERRG